MAHAEKGVSILDCRVMGIRERQWMDIITECNASHMNKKEWMKLHNISPKNFYRWQKVLRERALNKMEDYGYPILPRYAEGECEASGREQVTDFVEITGIIGQEKEKGRTLVSAEKNQIEPELMIQIGSYQLYIGSGVTESTLATVLKVIGHA